MKYRLLSQAGGERRFILVFAAGDEVMRELNRFAQTQRLGASRFSGIGAFEQAALGYFDWQQKTYVQIEVGEQVELLAINGDIAVGEQGPVVHAHVVISARDGAARGGHLLEGRVRPTLEMFLTDFPAQLGRKHDPLSGLALIDL